MCGCCQFQAYCICLKYINVGIVCVCNFSLILEISTDKQEGRSNEPASSTQVEMKQHGLLNRKANINVHIDEHSVVEESEENTDIIHNLGE